MNVVDIINKAISERRTRFAFELLPPLKGDGCCGVFGSIDRLIGFDPAYINVTFHREGIKQAVRPDGSVEWHCLLYTSPSPRDRQKSRMPSSA